MLFRSNGELNQNVEITNIHELAILAHSFNKMSQQLASSQQELEKYSRTLEEQVERRTEELQQEIIDRNVANDTIIDPRLQFKKNRANYKSKSSQ